MSKLQKYKARVAAKAREQAQIANVGVTGLATAGSLGVIDAKAPSVANIGPGLDVLVGGTGAAVAVLGPKKYRLNGAVMAVVAFAGKIRSKAAEYAAKFGD